MLPVLQAALPALSADGATAAEHLYDAATGAVRLAAAPPAPATAAAAAADAAAAGDADADADAPGGADGSSAAHQAS